MTVMQPAVQQSCLVLNSCELLLKPGNDRRLGISLLLMCLLSLLAKQQQLEHFMPPSADLLFQGGVSLSITGDVTSGCLFVAYMHEVK